MQSIANRKLRTCRYWALGPRCPNVNSSGVDVCDYAHRITGKLASHFEQRGTCLVFAKNGVCQRGANCAYEHRQTGVTGLYQGTLELQGFELEVANAAYRGGFDTSNGEALFDLIWSVKRVAMRPMRPAFPPKQLKRPSHPIYPERYRPSGIGDNTRRQLRGPGEVLGLKFHPIPPLMRKRKNVGTKDDPISIDSDVEDNQNHKASVNPSGKRQKISQPQKKSKGQRKRENKSNRAAKKLSGLPGTGANSVPVGTLKPKGPGTATGGQFLAACEQLKTSASQNTQTLKAFIAKPMQIVSTATTGSPDEQIAMQLLLVKTKLDSAKRGMNDCQGAMKTMFDRNSDRFDNDAILPILKSLANCMNKAYDGARDGIVEIEKAVEWIGDTETRIL